LLLFLFKHQHTSTQKPINSTVNVLNKSEKKPLLLLLSDLVFNGLIMWNNCGLSREMRHPIYFFQLTKAPLRWKMRATFFIISHTPVYIFFFFFRMTKCLEKMKFKRKCQMMDTKRQASWYSLGTSNAA
jgi:hypothetical protein